jgi:hypothetical protein
VALIAPLFALLGRFVGRILTTTLGWASILLFGRVPQDRQVWLAVLTFGSLVWVAAIAGVLVPDLGAFLLTALPRPAWIPEDLVRLAMLAVALILPAVLGGVTLLLFEPDARPTGIALAQQVLRGYGLAPALAVTLIVLAVAGTLRKLDSLLHRRKDAHVPIVVRPGRYDALIDSLEETLRDGGLVDSRRDGSAVLTVPARILAAIAGRGIGRLVPDRLVELHGPRLALSIYPADLALTGAPSAVARARALVARDISSRDAWFTTPSEAQALEDRIASLEDLAPQARQAALPDIDRRLLDLTIDDDTFDVLYRRRLQVAVPEALDVHDDTDAAGGSARDSTEPAAARRVTAGTVLGIAVAVLAVADLILTGWWTRAGTRRDRRA